MAVIGPQEAKGSKVGSPVSRLGERDDGPFARSG